LILFFHGNTLYESRCCTSDLRTALAWRCFRTYVISLRPERRCQTPVAQNSVGPRLHYNSAGDPRIEARISWSKLGYSQADKIAAPKRIVETAAKRFREFGLEGVSVAEVMSDTGLTVGGSYKHFRSRDDLISDALSEALRDIEPWEEVVATDPQQAMPDYVSERHRDNIPACCPIAALVTDVTRSTGQTREICTAKVRHIFDLLEKSVAKEHCADRRPQAMLAFGACVGAITLSRAVSDPECPRRMNSEPPRRSSFEPGWRPV